MICNKLIDEVVNKDLCTHCGTCIGICPTQALDYVNDRVISIEKNCINCNRCVLCCPGKYFDFQYYNNQIFLDDYKNIDVDLGHYRQIYKGYTNDDQLRKNASSGGIITELLRYLIENRIVDGVVVSDASSGILDYKAFITSDVKKILNSTQSKYVVFPVNKIIQEIEKFNGRIAFVGLPCQIQGMRKAQENHIISNEIFYISLFCGFNLYREATNILLQKMNVKMEESISIRYRKKEGESTGFEVIQRNHERKFIEKHSYNFLNIFYSPIRCLKCYDFSGEFADLSIGDAWEENGGWSRIIIRSEWAEKIIKQMINEKKINVSNSSRQDIVQTQKQLLDYKKKWFFVRKQKMEYFPENNISETNLTGEDWIKGNFFFLILKFGHSKIGKIMLHIFPIWLLGSFSKIARRGLNEH